jgi:23S rRNA (guanine745-N1)-methyltransferase
MNGSSNPRLPAESRTPGECQTTPWLAVIPIHLARRLPGVLPQAIELLRCPHCGGPLSEAESSLTCAERHSFDLARQGYVNLLPGGAETGTADPAEMVDARDAFLATGAYRPLAERVADATGRLAPRAGCVIDLGAGTGYYLAAVLARDPERVGLALDLSKYAGRKAARSHPRAAAVVCDAWRPLPIRDASAAAVLSVFSPRNPAEIARVLDTTGVFVLAAPTEGHLADLVAALDLLKVDERKRERLDEKLGSRFVPVEEDTVEYGLAVGHDSLRALVGMGPSAYHVEPGELDRRVAALPDPFEITVSVSVAAFRVK